jgi:hypothetical protein
MQLLMIDRNQDIAATKAQDVHHSKQPRQLDPLSSPIQIVANKMIFA